MMTTVNLNIVIKVSTSLIKHYLSTSTDSNTVELKSGKSCYPYTRVQRGISEKELEVTFLGESTKAHTVFFGGSIRVSDAPRYIFTRQEDFIAFQSEVRGKELVDSFICKRIRSVSRSATISENADASDEVLKIWRDPLTNAHSISYYTSRAKEPCHLEFSVTMLEVDLSDEFRAVLNFTNLPQVNWNRGISRWQREMVDSETPRSSGSTSTEGQLNLLTVYSFQRI